jgi:hypothetical protein
MNNNKKIDGSLYNDAISATDVIVTKELLYSLNIIYFYLIPQPFNNCQSDDPA